MAVDEGDGGGVRDADVVGGDAQEGAVLFVGGVDGEVAGSEAGLVGEPEVGEAGEEGAWEEEEGGAGEEGAEVEGEGEEEEEEERCGGGGDVEGYCGGDGRCGLFGAVKVEIYGWGVSVTSKGGRGGGSNIPRCHAYG